MLRRFRQPRGGFRQPRGGFRQPRGGYNQPRGGFGQHILQCGLGYGILCMGV